MKIISVWSAAAAAFLLSLVALNAETTPSGLVAQWSAENDAVDSVGSYNGTTMNISYVPGYAGSAFGFDGTGWVDVGPTIGVFGTNDFTIDFWIQTTSSDPQTILSRRAFCNAIN